MTHTRIPDKSGHSSYGGSYHIPNEDDFLKIYYNDIISKNKTEHLTEKQLDNGAIAIDLDLHFPPEIKTRKITNENINNVVYEYLSCLENHVYQLCEYDSFPVFVMQKTTVNLVLDKKITKDGLHIIIGIKMPREQQVELRKLMLPRITDLLGHLGLINSWEDVYDLSVTSGNTNWQLYGSSKPQHDVYRLTSVYHVTVDVTDSQLVIHSVDPSNYLNDIHLFKQLSVRYSGHPELYARDSFMQKIADKVAPPRVTKSICLPTTRAELDTAVAQYLDSLPDTFNKGALQQAHDYVMILPAPFFDDRNQWMRVGWALKNSSEMSFLIWMKFSAQSQKFSYGEMQQYLDNWNGWISRDSHKLTLGSIITWARQSAVPAEFQRVKSKWSQTTVVSHERPHSDSSLTLAILEQGQGMVAKFLAEHCKDLIYCRKVWRYYNANTGLWEEIEDPTAPVISFMQSAIELAITNLTDKIRECGGNAEQKDSLLAQQKKLINCRLKVCQCAYTVQVIRCLKTELVDHSFVDRLDFEPYRIVFRNGILNLKDLSFRKGILRSDFVTKTIKFDFEVPSDADLEFVRLQVKKICNYNDIHLEYFSHQGSYFGKLRNKTN